MKLITFLTFIYFLLFSLNPNAQNLDWVKQIYHFDFDQSGQYMWSYHLDHQALYGSSQSPTNFNHLKMIEPNSMFVTNYRGGATLFKLGVNGDLGFSNQEYKTQTLNLYPNANNGKLYFNHEFGEAEAEIISLSGKLIHVVQLTKSLSKINVDLEQGTYFPRVRNEVSKFVVY